MGFAKRFFIISIKSSEFCLKKKFLWFLKNNSFKLNREVFTFKASYFSGSEGLNGKFNYQIYHKLLIFSKSTGSMHKMLSYVCNQLQNILCK